MRTGVILSSARVRLNPQHYKSSRVLKQKGEVGWGSTFKHARIVTRRRELEQRMLAKDIETAAQCSAVMDGLMEVCVHCIQTCFVPVIRVDSMRASGASQHGGYRCCEE